MRTTKSTVTFQAPFVLDDGIGELPAGSYDIEVDEEEFLAGGQTGYRRLVTYFYVSDRGSTRMLVLQPEQLETALARDEALGDPDASIAV